MSFINQEYRFICLSAAALLCLPGLAMAQKLVVLTVPSASVALGATVKLSAKVSNGGFSISNNVHFQQNTLALKGSPVKASKGLASLVTPALTTAGAYTYRAAYYFSDKPTVPVYSTNVVVTVAKATPAVTWGTMPSAMVGGAATLSATVSGYQPTGNVTFRNTADGTSCVGAINVSTRVASCALTPASAGAKALVAEYAGDTNNIAKSASATLNVAKANPTLSWGALPAAVTGKAVTLSVTVGGFKPSGNVTLTSTSDSNVNCTGPVNPTTGVAACDITFAMAGTKILSASYSGDTNHASKTASTTLVVKATTAVSLVTPVVVRWAGSETVDLTATLLTGNPASGSIQFIAVLNGASTELKTVQLNGNRTATAQVALSGVGQHQVKAVFTGDATQASAESAPVSITATTPLTSEPLANGYLRQMYVDVAAPDCADNCGGVTTPYRNLKTAFENLLPGTELVIAGRPGHAYYVMNDGGMMSLSPQQFLSLPKFPKPNGAPIINVSNPTTDPAMAPTLVRAWGGNGGAKPVVRGTVKVGGWQPVNGLPDVYAVQWDMKAAGLAQKKKDPQGNVAIGGDGFPIWEYLAVVRPQQIYRDGLPSGSVKLEQVGGVLYNAERYDLPAAVKDYQMNFQWPERGGESARLIGRIAPVMPSPWLHLKDNQFYVHAPLKSGTNDIDNTQPVTVYVKLKASDGLLATGATLEISAQQFLLNTCAEGIGCAANLIVKDLVLERSNGSAYSSQNTAVMLAGEKVLADGITVQHADAFCVMVWGKQVTLRNSTIEYCGLSGVTGAGSGHLIDANRVRYNNAKGFNEIWVASGMKFAGSETRFTQSIVSNNEVSFNDGTGIWLDTDPSDILIENNFIGMNGRVVQQSLVNGVVVSQGGVTGHGVHLEIVSNNTVRGNTIVGNASAGVYLIGNGSGITDNFIAANMGAGVSRNGDDRLAAKGMCLLTNSGNSANHNLFAWNDEVVRNKDGGINKVSMARTVADASNNNVFCGSSTSMTSLSVSTDGATLCGHSGPAYFDIQDWRTATGQDAQSTRVSPDFATTVGSATIEHIKQRSADFWASVLRDDFLRQASGACGAPAGWTP